MDNNVSLCWPCCPECGDVLATPGPNASRKKFDKDEWKGFEGEGYLSECCNTPYVAFLPDDAGYLLFLDVTHDDGSSSCEWKAP